MKIKELILLLLRKGVFIALGLIIGLGAGNFIANNQSPVFEASTKLFVSRNRQQSSSDVLSLSNEQLLAINLQMAKSQPILNEASSQLGSKIDADNILVEAIPNTLIINIKVQDNDPKQAAKIANLLAQTIMQRNNVLITEFYTGFETAINDQLEPAQIQITNLQNHISEIKNADVRDQLTKVNQQINQIKTDTSNLEKDIAGFPSTLSPVEVISLAEKQAQLDQLHSLMTLYQQIQANLVYIGQPGQNEASLEDPTLSSLQSTLGIYKQIEITLINGRENVRLARAQSKQNVTQIVVATVPKTPVRPIPVLYLMLGGGVGLALAVVGILITDHLDESFKSVDQLENILGIPVLGNILDSRNLQNQLVTNHSPNSKEAESFYTLGATIEITAKGSQIQTLMVVNSEPTGRPTIAANLAVAFALQGKSVILMDGDLKTPTIHSLFGLENRNGLAEILNEKVELALACHKIKDVKGLSLIPAGMRKLDESRWLDPEKLSQLTTSLKQHADLLIVNSPPAGTADAQVLASKMDAVVLVIKSGLTTIASAQSALKNLQLINARILGSILYQLELLPKLTFDLKNTIKKVRKPKPVNIKTHDETQPPFVTLSSLPSAVPPQTIFQLRSRHKKHKR